jgi:ribosomal protein L21E
MQISGKVVKRENLRGGISITITPEYDQGVESPYFMGRPKGNFELVGLADRAGKEFKAGQTVIIEINPEVATPVPVDEVESTEETEGADLGYGDDSAE